MKKNRIRLTESQLHRVIKESVKRMLKEDDMSSYNEDANKLDQELEKSMYLAYNYLYHVKKLMIN